MLYNAKATYLVYLKNIVNLTLLILYSEILYKKYVKNNDKLQMPIKPAIRNLHIPTNIYPTQCIENF